MTKTREQIIDELRGNNEEFQSLWEEHQTLEQQLTHLDSKVALSADEEMEMKRLKKIKLAGKDKMEQMILAAKPAA